MVGQTISHYKILDKLGASSPSIVTRMKTGLRHHAVWFLALGIVASTQGQVGGSWTIDTFAGSVPGPTGPALEAFLSFPRDLAVAGTGRIFIPDSGFDWVREVSPAAASSAGGPGQIVDRTISVFAGNGELRFNGDDQPAVNAALFNPNSVTVGSRNDVYIADVSSFRIRRVDENRNITTVVGTGRVGRELPTGQAATEFALGFVDFIEYDPNSDVLYIGQRDRIWQVADGLISHFAGNGERGFSGDGGDPKLAQFNRVVDLAIGIDGSVYLADLSNRRVREIDATGSVVNTTAGSGRQIFEVIPDGTPADEANLGFLRSVAVDPAGLLHFSDTSGLIHRREPDGTLTLVANLETEVAPGSSADRIAFDAEGNLYALDRGTHEVRLIPAGGGEIISVAGTPNLRGDGGPALQARLHRPIDVTFDSQGNLIIADSLNFAIRAVSPTGDISRLAGNGDAFGNPSADDVPGLPTGIGILNTVDAHPSGQTLFDLAGRMRAITAQGRLRVVPGFEAGGTERFSVRSIHSAADGTVYFANVLSTVVRTGLDGSLTTVAGNGSTGFSGDGGPATEATFNQITGVTTGPATLIITTPDGTREASIEVTAVAPGLFSIDSTGVGTGAITGLRVALDQSRSAVDTFRFDTDQQQFVGVPINVAAEAGQVFLTLFGTGIRGVSSAEQIAATINGETVPLLAFAPSGEFDGLDQVSIGPLPADLVGSGEVEILLTVDGVASNPVTVVIE